MGLTIDDFHVDQKVRALRVLGDAPSGDSPGGVYAMPGEILIVRRILKGLTLPISVSHLDITDNSFGVSVGEIEPVREKS